MLHVALLLLSWAAAQDAPTLKAELKDIPAKGAGRPVILCEGTATVPDGAVLGAHYLAWAALSAAVAALLLGGAP